MAADPRFAEEQRAGEEPRASWRRRWRRRSRKHDREPLLKVLEEAGVPATPVNTVDQVMNDPQTAARGDDPARACIRKLGEIPVVGTPLKFSRMNPGVRTAAPLRGEHTDTVLASLGYTADEIKTLRAKKAALVRGQALNSDIFRGARDRGRAEMS